ncbi:uncharacterized protein LOC121261390 [Juglans microcarpa x Juglans regia]|uniref:uncharacterized protein LOC121261390 n=1 Tax=Juglans microcarpa x Juglans regia TaxID=2249226 RepID=UPI001B7EF65D|nr:uncharacterized protein LOC121261390 [Juglans microcarpa x Juglans regia]
MGNPGEAGASGVIRNSNGKFICGFSNSLGAQSNNAAEVLSILHGLRIVYLMGFRKAEMEMDSKLVVNWLKKKRESNAVADVFAKMDAKGLNKLWVGNDGVPASVKGFLRLDIGSVPYTRTCS